MKRMVDYMPTAKKDLFLESHMHLWEYCLFELFTPITDCINLEDIATRLNANPVEGGWLVGKGMVQDNLEEKVIPDRNMLDSVFGKKPVVLVRVCLHVLSMNTAAMERLGCMSENGIFQEADVFLILDKLSEMTGLSAKEISSRGIEQLKSLGITRVINMSMTSEIMKRLPEGYFFTTEHELLDRGAMGLKLFADGSMGARTAAMTEPYADDPGNYGLLNYSDSELLELVELAHRAGKPCAIHAIGDRAVAQVLNVLKKTRHPLDRLEHVNYCTEALLDEIAKLEIPICIQPIFGMDNHAVLCQRFGENRIKNVYPWLQMKERGIYLMAGSDAPVAPPDPRMAAMAAYNSANPNQKLEIDFVIDLYARKNWDFYSWTPA